MFVFSPIKNETSVLYSSEVTLGQLSSSDRANTFVKLDYRREY